MSHKIYEPKTEYYRELLRACRAELITLGYGAQTARLNGVGELLRWLERRGMLRIDTIGRADMELFLVHLHTRPSQRDGGGLSEYTVGHYLYAARLLLDYCERHGLRGAAPWSAYPVGG